MTKKVLSTIGIGALVIAGLDFGWKPSSEHGTDTGPGTLTSRLPGSPSEQVAAKTPSKGTQREQRSERESHEAGPNAEVAIEIARVLRDSGIGSQEAASELIALATRPDLPVESRLEALEHGLTLTDNRDYQGVQPLLEDAETPEPLLDVLFLDLHDRSPEVVLPASLQLTRNQGHPLNEQARDLVSFFLGEDFGDDWSAWERELASYLADTAWQME